MKEGRKGNWNGKEESSSESFRLKIRIKLNQHRNGGVPIDWIQTTSDNFCCH